MFFGVTLKIASLSKCDLNCNVIYQLICLRLLRKSILHAFNALNFELFLSNLCFPFARTLLSILSRIVEMSIKFKSSFFSHFHLSTLNRSSAFVVWNERLQHKRFFSSFCFYYLNENKLFRYRRRGKRTACEKCTTKVKHT